METLSTSVSTLQLHGLSSTAPREHSIFKPPNPTHLPPSYSHLYNKPNPISNRPSSPFNNKATFTTSAFHSPTPTSSLKAATPVVHKKAASGYAAALVDAARCNGNLDMVEKDVRRLSKYLRNEQLRAILVNPSINDNTKGQVVKQLVEKGKFQKHLVVVLKMVVEKSKVGIVNEVLEEFQRIYDELNKTQVVFVSSKKKMEEDQLLGIAKRVQKMSGAMKVKVWNLIRKGSPSFAM